MEEIALAAAALTLLEKLFPRIEQMVQSGQITPDQQKDIRTRYASLRNAGDAAFTGPEWETK